MALLMLACVFFAWAFAYKYILRLIRPRLGSLPGPLPARVSPLYRIWLLCDGKGPIHYAELHHRYGPIVQTGPNHISIADPSCIPVVYDTKNLFVKSEFYNVFRPLFRGQPMDTVFTTQDVAHNKRLKAILCKNLTTCSSLFLGEIKESIDTFVGQMMESQEESVDLSYWSFFWSFDITFALIFGVPYGYMKNRADWNQWIYTFKTITGFAAILGQTPEWCSWTLANDRVMGFLRHFQTFPDPTQEFMEEVENRIKLHDETTHRCDKTFICKVLADRKNLDNFDEHATAVNILFETFFAAAAEVAVTLGTTFYCLLSNPDVYCRLVTGIRSNPAVDATCNSRYITAVIKESLRLYSSNSPPMERVVPESGMSFNGHHIPGGTIVSVPQYVVHRDTAVYGEDAHIFRPERWLEADEPTLRLMERNFLAFGRGTRACVGRDLAMLQLRMILTNVLKTFDIRFTHPENPPKITMYWMLDHVGLDVKFRQANA
ncbi:cytochrome P450 [Astrocystis sublimbata]|nr:cytochrome P450 [Astrocystis sublimbata]